MARGSGGRIQGQSPGRDRRRSPPEAEAKCEISCTTFNGFNEYIGAELGQYILQTQFKKILNAPLGTPMGLPKATERVDSRLKLTFGKIVSQLITCDDKLTIQ